ncbi:uncharacterized protein B0H18DRAFT_1033475 [Fomitopsis serialis]|uniref:uncharacterized protein n=1 Tax=Fomitopsis serialis TaxID=139415 RepID=UPI002008DDC0|nr:uncharacterized protein B0H18DRAFT_1033475 [Neoantrodia serialis]KAH9917706.1 hypothetical protein B0H18DRAFT_1033475 [Neoantrodia serialis]
MSSSPGPGPLAQEKISSSQSSKRRAIADVISQTYPPFDHRSTIVEPFDNESKRDVEFLEKLNAMLLELMLDFHAWSTARPAHESDTNADALEKEVKVVIEFEKEQGMSSLIEKTRQRLNEFVTRIKLALAALTGLSG